MNFISNIVDKLYERKSPDELYEEYLSNHIQGIRDSYFNIIKPILLDEGITESDLSSIESLIDEHDKSKRSSEEWSAYRNHFYNPKDNPRSHDLEFNLAWNHHQKHNPHHWQYWCLINDVDNPQIEALEMPFKYIIEMLCDWQSAGNYYGNTAYEYYNKQKNKMILHDNTRKLVEKYIEYFK